MEGASRDGQEKAYAGADYRPPATRQLPLGVRLLRHELRGLKCLVNLESPPTDDPDEHDGALQTLRKLLGRVAAEGGDDGRCR